MASPPPGPIPWPPSHLLCHWGRWRTPRRPVISKEWAWPRGAAGSWPWRTLCLAPGSRLQALPVVFGGHRILGKVPKAKTSSREETLGAGGLVGTSLPAQTTPGPGRPRLFSGRVQLPPLGPWVRFPSSCVSCCVLPSSMLLFFLEPAVSSWPQDLCTCSPPIWVVLPFHLGVAHPRPSGANSLSLPREPSLGTLTRSRAPLQLLTGSGLSPARVGGSRCVCAGVCIGVGPSSMRMGICLLCSRWRPGAQHRGHRVSLSECILNEWMTGWEAPGAPTLARARSPYCAVRDGASTESAPQEGTLGGTPP